MRILIACHAPLQRELGAAQISLNLADALRTLGHSVCVWSPWPLPPGTSWVNVEFRMSRKLGDFLRTESFDLVDCPAVLTRPRFLKPSVQWICRSVQPDILYIWEKLRGRRRTSPVALAKTAVVASRDAVIIGLIYRGWSLAKIIMCLGEIERAWMARVFPWLKPKLRAYDAAISAAEGAELEAVRRARRQWRPGEPIRYLWIGRWTEHKGTCELVAFLKKRLVVGAEEQFTVAGCGVLGEQALAPLRASGRVQVIPTFTRAELPKLLASHHAGLFTSRVEGWGLVLNEMVQSGLPLYATPAGGVHELRGVLGPSVQSFPPPLRAGPPPLPTEDARNQYLARFRWESIAKRYLEAVAGA